MINRKVYLNNSPIARHGNTDEYLEQYHELYNYITSQNAENIGR